MDISHQTKFKSIWPLNIYHVVTFGKEIRYLSANVESLTPCDI